MDYLHIWLLHKVVEIAFFVGKRCDRLGKNFRGLIKFTSLDRAELRSHFLGLWKPFGDRLTLLGFRIEGQTAQLNVLEIAQCINDAYSISRRLQNAIALAKNSCTCVETRTQL